MKAIIFGISGQDGYYLSELLNKKNYVVIGVSRNHNSYVIGDISNFNFVESLIKNEKPDIIYHLAANSSTNHNALFENHETISTGTLNILESVYKHCKDCKVFLSGSAMQFSNSGLPINEQTPFEASSPYSIARIQSVYAGRYYRSKGLKVYVGYFFNHESPLRTQRHVSKYITDMVKKINNGINEKINLGDISVKKEWNYAGDFVNAIHLLTSQDRIVEAVIGSGESYSIKNWLEVCFKKINRNWEEFVVLSPGFIPEYRLLVSDPALIFSLGYKPNVNFEQLSNLMLNNN